MNLEGYRTYVFDCDGVVLDSNRVKTEAFRLSARAYGERAANVLVNYHIMHGGISRYRKFAEFLDVILPVTVPGLVPGRDGPDLDALLQSYASCVRAGLMCSTVAPGLADLRARTAKTSWLLVSGGDQKELRDVFAVRGIADYFDGGIFGSPDSKETILARELASGAIRKPALFLGDSEYDHIAAANAGLDFFFLSGWTEMPAWKDYVAEHGLQTIAGVADLLSDG
jgi:phosphoglycolate phosphatase-like HAD superfamily hydrolase